MKTKRRAIVIAVSGEALKELNDLLDKGWTVDAVHTPGAGTVAPLWLVFVSEPSATVSSSGGALPPHDP
jgi:hypothetical protein